MSVSTDTATGVRSLLEGALWWAQQVSAVQTAVAASKTLFAMALLGVVAPAAPVVVALISLAVYTANDLADRSEDAINCPARSAFVGRHCTGVVAVSGLALVVGAGLALAVGGPVALGVALVPVAAAVCYSVPLVPGRPRCKDHCPANTTLVAGAWAVTVTGMPLALTGTGPGPLAVGVALFVFLRTVVSVEVCNVRDLVGDAATGVETLPVVLGIRRTRYVLLAVDVASLAVLVALTAVDTAAVPALFGLALVSYSVSVTWLVGRTAAPERLCLAKDGEYILLGLVALAL